MPVNKTVEEEEDYDNIKPMNMTEELKKVMLVHAASSMEEKLKLAAEYLYATWIIISFSLCSGMFIEHPVLERFSKMRYYLNVIGLYQSAYWIGSLLFDFVIYGI